MILNGATVSTIRSDTNERLARRKFIAGDFPTGQEFVFLMKNPIHQQVFEKDEPAWAEITICDRKFRFHALGIYEVKQKEGVAGGPYTNSSP
jgi:hypothetical protein